MLGNASGREGILEIPSSHWKVVGLLVRKSEIVENPASDLLREGIAFVEERQRLLESADGVDITSLLS